jgi:hypothetical protein
VQGSGEACRTGAHNDHIVQFVIGCESFGHGASILGHFGNGINAE